MGDATPVPRSAVVHIPNWLWGGDPSKFFREANLKGQDVDRGSGLWRIQTEEAWRRSKPSFVTVKNIAGPTLPRPRFRLLEDATTSGLSPFTAAPDLIAAINRLAERAERTRNPADSFAYSQLRIIAVNPQGVSREVQTTYQNLISAGIDGKPDYKIFANAGVHVTNRTPELLHRLKLPSVWLRTSVDQQLGRGDLSQIIAAAASGETVFASSEGLYDGIYTLDAYVAPLLGALTPAVWGFTAIRTLGIISSP